MATLKSVIFLFISAAFLLAGCSKSDDQRQFEDRAYSVPEGITVMNANGNRVENENNDPDDWEVSPVYSGYLNVEAPAYPNPVKLNSHITIDIQINSIIYNLTSLHAFAFKHPGELSPEIARVDLDGLSSGFVTLIINPQSITGSSDTGHNPSDIYRILIYDDGQRNLITYGDVQIE